MNSGFRVDGDAYDDFMGRYSTLLARRFADFAGIGSGMRVLDVGAGTGALTAELVSRGASAAAADPSPEFVAAFRQRFPDVEVHEAPAEELPGIRSKLVQKTVSPATRLAEHGYILGQNLTFDARGAMGDVAKLPSLLGELKARDVDAIIVTGYPAALAAKSTGIATVGAIGLGDPVETRLIDSLAHPGGNITGISDVATTLTTKRLSLLKEMSPKLQKVAMLWNKDDLGMSLRYEASAKVASHSREVS